MKKFMRILSLALAALCIFSLVSCSLLDTDDGGDAKEPSGVDDGGSGVSGGGEVQPLAFYEFYNDKKEWCLALDGEIVMKSQVAGKLVIADDASFAYVINGYGIDVVSRDGIQRLADDAYEVLALATLEVGAVYANDGGVYLCRKKGEEKPIETDYESIVSMSANQYIISADASVVAFAEAVLGDNATSDTDSAESFAAEGERALYIYRDDTLTLCEEKIIPEALSDDGRLLYGRASIESSALVVYNTETKAKNRVFGSVIDIVDMTADGSGLVFTAYDSRMSVGTYVTAVDCEYLTVKKIAKIADGSSVTPIQTDASAHRFDLLADKYFECRQTTEGSTEVLRSLYYLDGEYNTHLICSGDFKTDGELKSIYCVDGDAVLSKIDAENPADVRKTEISQGVTRYEVMPNGSVYYVGADGTLVCLDGQTGERTDIAQNVCDLTSYAYAKIVYFSTDDNGRVMYIDSSGERVELEIQNEHIEGIFRFVNTHSERAYALNVNLEEGMARVYYTDDGAKSFKLCSDLKIPGVGSSAQ